RSEVRAAIGIGIGQLGFETEEIPGRPAKDARLLLLIDVAIRIDPIGYPGEPFRRPAASLRCNRHGILSSASVDIRRADITQPPLRVAIDRAAALQLAPPGC